MTYHTITKHQRQALLDLRTAGPNSTITVRDKTGKVIHIWPHDITILDGNKFIFKRRNNDREKANGRVY